MTREELQAKIVEATLGGGFKRCRKSGCRRQFIEYQMIRPLRGSVANPDECAWCFRRVLAREFDSLAHDTGFIVSGREQKMDDLHAAIAEVDAIIKEQEWVLAL